MQWNPGLYMFPEFVSCPNEVTKAALARPALATFVLPVHHTLRVAPSRLLATGKNY